MIHNHVSKIAWKFRYSGAKKYLNNFSEQEYWTRYKLEQSENIQLNKYIKYVVENSEYYNSLFKAHGILPDDIQEKKDLERIPILTKELIRKNYSKIILTHLFKGRECSTGGSTGKPLKYYMTKEDQDRGVMLEYRLYMACGYNIGDKIYVLGGGSLYGSDSIAKRMKLFLLNHESTSSYGISEEKFDKLYAKLRNERKVFLYGYPSTMYLLSRYILKTNRFIDSEGSIFTTAECLLPIQRNTIEKAFRNAKVFDTYGMNDGGLHACECEEHNGLHVSYGRGIAEVVDQNLTQVYDQPGEILATSIYNYAFPFVRYAVEDRGILTRKQCACGRNTDRIIEIEGRKTDYLEYKGKYIGSPVLTVLMGKFPEVNIYRVIQVKSDQILIMICFDISCKEERIEEIYNNIKKSIKEKIGDVEIIFERYTDERLIISKTDKFRIIINKTLNDN